MTLIPFLRILIISFNYTESVMLRFSFDADLFELEGIISHAVTLKHPFRPPFKQV